MLKLVLSFFLLGLIALADPAQQVIVLSSHKNKKKAKLDLAPLEKEFHFHKGYPKLVESKSIGLASGSWVWIAGYCIADETAVFAPDHGKPATVNLPLDEQKFLLKKLKAIQKSTYAKTAKSGENTCPIDRLKTEILFLSKAGPSATGHRWSKKPFSFPELSRFAIYLSPEQAEASNYLASYGYKYMQKDENLLQIIYRNGQP
tara:strand:- start:84694 stop:85302 length:609 start_codon:yes stop_codon:yes gene_type:complete